jgi:pyridoxine 4-dehydrogenase
VLEYYKAAGIAFLPWLPVANGAHAAAEGPLVRVAGETGGSPVRVGHAR